MIAFVNSIVAGTGVALLAGALLGCKTAFSLFAGVTAAAIHMALFLVYQRWRFGLVELEESIGEQQ